MAPPEQKKVAYTSINANSEPKIMTRKRYWFPV